MTDIQLQVMELLVNHVGKAEAITSSNIRAICGIKDREVREVVNVLRVLGYPICSGNRGYYLASDVMDLKKTIISLRRRIKGIKKAIRGLETSINTIEKINSYL